MKRTLLFIFSILMIATAMLPASAAADTQREMDADYVLICNPLPYDRRENKLNTGTLPQHTDEDFLEAMEYGMPPIAAFFASKERRSACERNAACLCNSQASSGSPTARI